MCEKREMVCYTTGFRISASCTRNAFLRDPFRALELPTGEILCNKYGQQKSVHATLAQLKYSSQQMPEFIAKWKACSAQLASINAPIGKKILMKLCTEFFGEISKSPYGSVISALRIRGI